MILARLFLFVVLALAPTSAMAVTINFNSLSSENPATPHTEGLFTYQRLFDNVWAYNSNSPDPTNPTTSLITGFDLPNVTDNIPDIFEIYLTGGGLFTLTSFRYASFFEGPSDTVDFIGVTGGNDSILCSGIQATSPNYQTNSTCSPASTMDHLYINVTNTDPSRWLHIDDICLNGDCAVPAPEPASLLLLGAGLVGIAARSRKSKA